MESVGVVVIGRNEGDRLQNCLSSISSLIPHVVYVDSGSIDGSVDLAKNMGAVVVELDLSRPFTAARARNEGFDHIYSLHPQLEYIQFIDGDCEIDKDWLRISLEFLETHKNFAAVCGRRRERYPNNSIYNLICDIEWDTPIGETRSCGGDALMQVDAFIKVKGFNSLMIAGEEPELCFRMRENNWKIMRLDAEMTLHDVAMTRFSQWWKRSVRSGHSYAEGMDMHGRSDEHFSVRQSLSQWVWAAVFPLILLSLVLPTHGLSLIGIIVYPLQVHRIFLGLRRKKLSTKKALLYSGSCIIGKWPQLQGQIQYLINKVIHKQTTLIEYKNI